ncbi:hypothetical protein A9R05_42530 (plasmid) [Burkholderia sp. KK1]|uniref:hypothetical protein n=1 Tax=Burkholderia sp. M701 TaxID=326454 RepID=UPI000979BB64|nr:hypothetical protein [Burkholderia sp. M701]AQH05698.1 hypothetical protein A9R05_42530 [Burkholderia sp. KK1]
MSQLENYSDEQKRRIKAIACALIEGQIANGTLACTEEAIRVAMPQAIEDARQTVMAVDEFLCG